MRYVVDECVIKKDIIGRYCKNVTHGEVHDLRLDGHERKRLHRQFVKVNMDREHYGALHWQCGHIP